MTTSKVFATAALLLGVAAMACTVIPSVVYDEPTRASPFSGGPGDRGGGGAPASASGDGSGSQAAGKDRDGGLTVQTRRFSFTLFRGKKQDEPQTRPAAPPAPAEAAPSPPAPAPTAPAAVSPARAFRVSGAGLALLGLTVAPFAWRHRRNRPLAVAAVGLCCLALTWQYVVVGIAVGAAIAILLIILSAFSA